MFSTVLTLLYAISALALAARGGSGDAIFEGARAAVDFVLETGGAICLWSGVLELMEQSGLSAALGRALRPVLGGLFPKSMAEAHIATAITENVSANLLGLGNAATPAGIRAAKAMAALGEKARDELGFFVVLNTASIQLLPATIASVRAAAGAQAAFDILPAVWLSSCLALGAGLGAAVVLRRLWK